MKSWLGLRATGGGLGLKHGRWHRARTRWLLALALPVGCGAPSASQTPEQATAEEQPAPPEAPSGPHRTQQAAVASDPELVRKLGSADTREQAVTQFIQRFSEVARNGTKTLEALAFSAAYADVASQAYIDGYEALPEPLRHKLLQTLLAFDHEHTTAAFAHAIRAYAATGSGADDAIWACQGAARRKAQALEDPLLEAYKAIDTSDKDGLRYSRHLVVAMSVQRTDRWNAEFEKQLNTPLIPPPRYDDKPAVRAYQSGLFRQTIATRLLGQSKSQRSAETLMGVLLDSNKAEIHPAAELSLANLGASAVPQLIQLLNQEGPFAEPAKQARADIQNSAVYFATKWLDLIRSAGTEADLLKAWTSSRDPVARTLIVRSLSRLPQSKGGIEALKTTYAQTDIKVTLPEGESALEVLAEAAVQFYDPALALWLRERTDHVPTVWTRRADVLTTLVLNMSRLVREQDLTKAEVTAQRYGGNTGTPAFLRAKALVQTCHEDSRCYLDEITKPGTAFGQIKAATMVGCFGSSESRDALIDVAIAIDTPDVLNQVLASLEELTVSDAQAAYAQLYEKSRQQLEAATPTWSRAKCTAIALTLARLKDR
jgi:hypothetical protein